MSPRMIRSSVVATTPSAWQPRADGPPTGDPDPRLVTAIAARLMEQVRPDASPMMDALWEAFWEASGRHRRSSRDVKGTWTPLNHYRFPDGRALAGVRASELGVGFPPAYRTWRRSQVTRLGRPPATGTINRELERLRAVINWAVGAGLLPHHPLCSIQMEAENSVKQTKIRTEEEFGRLLVACRAEHRYLPALVLLYFDSGLRRLEGMRAKWSEIERKPDGGGLLWLAGRRTKSGKPRCVHVTRRTMAELGLLPRLSDWVFANEHVYSTGKRAKRYGLPYNPTFLFRRFLTAVEASGLEAAEGEKITFHTLRHSFAYRARRNWRWPEQVIMRQGGWSTRSAFDRYGISDDEELAEAMATAERAIARDSATTSRSSEEEPR